MADTANEHPRGHMGLPLPHGKLAMWLFLVTEIMFFTALIGMYIVLRNGTPTGSGVSWPTPEDVHLVEWLGAVNTFVLIVSSLTVVLAHHAVHYRDFKKATMYIGVTFVLGLVFLGIKAVEYNSKFSHGILPGQIGELAPPKDSVWDDLDEEGEAKLEARLARREREHYPVARDYMERVRAKLTEISENPGDHGLAEDSEILADVKTLLTRMQGQSAANSYQPPLSPTQLGKEVNELLHKAEEAGTPVHVPPAIPFGNLWASCYFAMTGFHALHVLGGLVIFGIILIMGWRNKLGPQHESLLELTGLYWHFVDIVWIFLFPLLYLV